MIDVLEHLARDDKWFLGGAPALLFAPPAPIWLDTPGFWDAAHYLHFPIEPVFTFILLDETLKPIPLRFERRHWRPDRLQQLYSAPGLAVMETRTCGPEDVLSAVLDITNLETRERNLRLLLWTSQEVSDDSFRTAGECEKAVHVRREVTGLRQTRLDLSLVLALEGARSFSIDLSERTANQPRFQLTPYYETLTPGGLDNRIKLTGVGRDGLVYAACERPIELPAGVTRHVKMGACIAAEAAAADAALKRALEGDPPKRSERAWRNYFTTMPEFSCSDPYLETYYWYRWYGLRLNTIAVELGNYHHPAVAEGIGYFRALISYSAQCHMLETRWLGDPRLARGCLLNFIDNQRQDGSFPNHIHVNYIAPEGIYHADWGQRTLDVYDLSPNRAFLEQAYPALKRYAEYFYRERDAENSNLYDLVNQWESGQEYMSRYLWIDPQGDEWKPLERRLKGLDASVYIYRLERALARMSNILATGEEAHWTARAEGTAEAILTHCWSEELGAFVDVSPELERSELIFALSFYPFFTDLVGEEHLSSIGRYLLDRNFFWSEYPVPASPKSDPQFSAVPAWKGKRTNCPWNGRTWPMTNSHIAEALARASKMDGSLRVKAAEFIGKFIRMMFFDEDVKRPNCFEHYNPETGKPSAYRGIDDYQHSWVVDLIIKYVVGVRPEAARVVIDPFPFALQRFSLHGVHVRGHTLDVKLDDEGFHVHLDGEMVHTSPSMTAITLDI